MKETGRIIKSMELESSPIKELMQKVKKRTWVNTMVKLNISLTSYSTGFWENGRRHGEGMFTYPNKDIYSGWWKYGKKHGKGTYVFYDTKMRVIQSGICL
jgi:Uncharacterized protein conserved in bacteria